jgi:hypothetical protein
MEPTTEVVDEHLAKFPPFKGPRIGGNFDVDDNVLSGRKPFSGASYSSSTYQLMLVRF